MAEILKPDFIKLLGLIPTRMESGAMWVRSEFLQRALEEKCEVVYGDKPAESYWTPEKCFGDTHTAFIFGKQEIAKERLKAEFEATVTMSHGFQNKIYEIEHDELTRFKGKKVRVTVEEIEG